MEKPSLPKGTRDFGPAIMAKRQFIFQNIRTVFQKFGFQPLETPAMENLSTLTGKYGDEGDKLLFRILDSGEYFEKMRIDLANSNRIAKIKDTLYDFLRSLSKIIFKELPDFETRNVFKIIELYKKHFVSINSGSSLRLDQFDKEILQRFFEEEREFLTVELANFFIVAGLNKENFKEKFDHHFKQFRDNEINPRLLPIVLNYVSSREITPEITEKGLRYDLTVPFARYVVMNRGEISFPFKRYQIQPVWRADRPQKGRYREFYQCDADVVGTNSLLCEAEIILMIKEVFKGLNITDYTIKINHRGILSGIAEIIGGKGNETALFVAIDKLDKIGEEKVREELVSKGFNKESLDLLFNVLNVKGSLINKMGFLATKFETSAEGQRGLRDLREVFNILKDYQADDTNVEFDISLARGLSYYTGCIFEVKINNVSIGSVSGGGRYDNLTQTFGDKENLSGVGFSFGVDRIYDAMEELQLFPKEAQVSSSVLICHFDEDSMRYGLAVLKTLRDAGIASEIYPDPVKIKKQLDYANKKLIPYTIVIGSDEVKSGLLPLKNMERGEQEKLKLEEIIQKIK